MLRRSHSSVPLFDVRLNDGSNIILIKGTPEEASSVRLSGVVVLSAADNMSLKKVTLRVVGTMKIRWNESVTVPRMSAAQHPVRYEKVIFERDFSDFDLPQRGSRSNPGSGKATPVSSMTNLASYFSANHGHSSSSGSSTPGPSLQIGAGNHSLPFELVVPGDTPESVEGNENAQIVYTLVATVERGRFQSNLTSRKHLRVVRTLGIDTYDIAHTVSIENTWPGKVEYKIFVPSKAVPIGGQMELRFQLVPLVKGLKLGRIRTQILEHIQLSLPTCQTHSNERPVAEQSFEANGEDNNLDEWLFNKVVNVPRSLSKCTQDCVIQPNIKISHKLRVFIGLQNPDGHTSELRASLPIHLFISPRVAVSSIDATQVGPQSRVAGIQTQEEVLFENPTASSDETSAPPNYTEHVYDRIWSEVPTPMESPSPIASGAQTPAAPTNRSLNDLDSAQQAQLAAGLRALAMSREGTAPNSRSNSYMGSAVNSHSGSVVDIQALSRVPSYEHAMHDKAASDAAPTYKD